MEEEKLIIRGAGRRRTISISNTRNKTASKKNRREKGSRAEDLGSKPHSKGEAFSRSIFARRERTNAAEVIIIGSIRAMAKEKRSSNMCQR